jgi:putative transposase
MQELSYHIGILLSSYSQAINKQNNTTGSLFQQKTKAKCISEPGRKFQANWMEIILQPACTISIKIPGKQNLLNAWKIGSIRLSRYYIGEECNLKTNKSLLLSLADYDESTFYKDSYAVNRCRKNWKASGKAVGTLERPER